MNITLQMFKELINGFTQAMYPRIPVTKATYPINKILEELEEYFLRSTKNHPKAFYKDGNFPRLVKVVTRMLIYIGERDSHYRAMISILALQMGSLMARDSKRFDSPEQMVRWLSGREIKFKAAKK